MIYALELRLSFGLCCSLPTHPSKAPWYHISIRRATISLSLLFTLRHRSTLCESLSSSSTTTPIGTFTLEKWHAHHTKKAEGDIPSASVRKANTEDNEEGRITLDRERFESYVEFGSKAVVFNQSAFEQDLLDQFDAAEIGQEEYQEYITQSEYVEEASETLTSFLKSGQGKINSNGDFVPNEPGTNPIIESQNERDELCSQLIEENNEIQTEVNDLSDFYERLQQSKEILVSGLDSEPSKATVFATILADNPAFEQCINEVETITGSSDSVSMMISMVLLILSGVRIVFNSTGLGWIIDLIVLLVKSHFPSAVTGMNMLASSFFQLSDSLANFHIFWGDYTVVDPLLPLA